MPFKDENVISIEPDINIKEKFEQIDMLCNTEQRINNTVNARIKLTKEKVEVQTNIYKSNVPVITKQYDTDTDTEKDK
mgnify:CR=1 FL=1